MNVARLATTMPVGEEFDGFSRMMAAEERYRFSPAVAFGSARKVGSRAMAQLCRAADTDCL
jgi:hypothetical protein